MPNIVKVYNYDENGYITAIGEMDLDIFEEVPLNATIIQPSKSVEELTENERLKFDESVGAWSVEVFESDGNLEVEPPSNLVTDAQRIEDLEMALADLMGGM